jgi:hypothetical protein
MNNSVLGLRFVDNNICLPLVSCSSLSTTTNKSIFDGEVAPSLCCIILNGGSQCSSLVIAEMPKAPCDEFSRADSKARRVGWKQVNTGTTDVQAKT